MHDVVGRETVKREQLLVAHNLPAADEPLAQRRHAHERLGEPLELRHTHRVFNRDWRVHVVNCLQIDSEGVVVVGWC